MSSAVKSLYEAKTHLSALVDRAATGEEIIIAKNGVPMARLVPLAKRTTRRKPGGWKGKVFIADDFDAPLPKDVIDLFEEGPLEAAAALPWRHRDPFDRMLVAQASAEGLLLVTADRVILKYAAVEVMAAG